MNTSAVVITSILVIVLIIFGPLAIIWALNTLFGLTIAYTFHTWLAALLLSGAVVGNGAKGSKK